MCAIAGLINLNITQENIEKLQQTMHRRGPDENGYFNDAGCLLLHSRLTIIDPEGGKQPMTYHHGQQEYTIVYNGELYNTDELRKELQALGHIFTGRSDTEVILHGYAQWGERVLDKANGIFGFAIFEHRARILFIARDRLGVKPVFYKLHNGGIVFASEIKTILACPDVEAELDAAGISQLLLLGPGRLPGSGVFRGIFELEPGCFGRYSDGKWTIRRYWKLLDREHVDSLEETAEKVRELVTDSICRQMVSDFPIGSFLSGGLDSSLISAVCAKKMNECNKQLTTFSLDYQNNAQYFVPGKFQPNSDTEYIHIMHKYLSTDHYWTVLSVEDLLCSMQDATIARDLPGMADVDFSLLAFCKQISSRVKVALSGECADEIFGGYPWYRDPQVRDAEGFPWAQNTKYRTSFLKQWIIEQVDPAAFVRECYVQTIHESDILPGTAPQDIRIKQMTNLNMRWFMQTLLDRKDRMSMYSGLEVRVPFCDYRIAEYLYGVPWHFKDYGGQEKGLLRYAIRDLLPSEILQRRKSPYPKTYDPQYLTRVQQMLQQVVNDPQAPIHQIVKKEALQELLTAEYAWPWYGQLMRLPQTIAYMLQLNFWLEHYCVRIV